MLLRPATELDYPAIVALANLAYRGDGTSTPASWNIEAGIIAGQRLTDALLGKTSPPNPTLTSSLGVTTPMAPSSAPSGWSRKVTASGTSAS